MSPIIIFTWDRPADVYLQYDYIAKRKGILALLLQIRTDLQNKRKKPAACGEHAFMLVVVDLNHWPW